MKRMQKSDAKEWWVEGCERPRRVFKYFPPLMFVPGVPLTALLASKPQFKSCLSHLNIAVLPLRLLWQELARPPKSLGTIIVALGAQVRRGNSLVTCSAPMAD